jgi:hypothetical protein
VSRCCTYSYGLYSRIDTRTSFYDDIEPTVRRQLCFPPDPHPPTLSPCGGIGLIMGFLLAILTCACAFVTVAIGVPSNVTVDDQGVDPASKSAVSYSSGWSTGQTCPGCEAQPDAKQAYEGTWHDTTYDPAYAGRNIPRNATFEFNGRSLFSSS